MAITIAKTKAGAVSGVEIPDKDITVFKGIPFAAPPVGELRWKAPQPVQPWDGVRKADKFMPAPWQFPHTKGSFYDHEWQNEPFECSEDCLYLNVWTPAKTADEKLPVAVWIYGGGFMSGFAHEREFDGEAFASKNVVYVSINYRLHVFGFLADKSLEDENGRSGNYGTLDQAAALKWVHENISAFGGDPDNVMVFGQSAGQYYYGDCVTIEGADKMQNQSVILNVKTRQLFVKVGNASGEAKEAKIDLSRFKTLKPNATLTVLKGQPEDSNNYEQHPVAPVTEPIKVKKQMNFTLQPYSLQMITIQL